MILLDFKRTKKNAGETTGLRLRDDNGVDGGAELCQAGGD